MSDDTERKMTLRLPDSLHTAVVQAAEKDRRSIHAEILTLIEEALQTRGRNTSAQFVPHTKQYRVKSAAMSDSQHTWLTAADAAKVLKVSARQVHRYGELGQLVTRRAGRRVLFSAESVARLADELAVDYRPPPAPPRELQPMIDAIEQLQSRDERIDQRLERIERRVEQPITFTPPRWLVILSTVVVIAVILSFVVLLLILTRLPG